MDEKLREKLNEIFDEIKVPKETVSKTKNLSTQNSIKEKEGKISINKNINSKRIVYQVEGHKRKLIKVLCTAATLLILFIGAGAVILFKAKDQNTVAIQTNKKENIQVTEKQDKTDIKNIESVIENNCNFIFEGNIGTKNIRMALYRDGENLTASYITQNDKDEEINLHGTIQINNASFSLYSDNKDIIFKGNIIPFTKEEDGYIEGIFTSKKDETDVHFSLSYSYAIDTSFEKRYSWCCKDATTTEVEEFANKTKKYITENDINNFLSLINYPINVEIKNASVKINNAEEFKHKYNDIISTDFKTLISKVYTKYLMSNYDGIMLGSGEIWFTEVEGKLKIIAINN